MLTSNKPVRILHLDDHSLFGKGTKIFLEQYFLVDHIWIKDPEEALRFFEDELVNGRDFDLVISDINHPGIHGILFMQEVKRIAATFNRSIPLMIISMIVITKINALNVEAVENDLNQFESEPDRIERLRKFVKIVKSGMVDSILGKGTNGDELLEEIRRLVKLTK